MTINRCLFCGGDASAPNHLQFCDGRQGRIDAFDAQPLYGAQGDVPFEVESATSAEAAAKMRQDDLTRLEQLVYDTLQTPRTCDEVERLTGLPHQTASARIRGLVLRDQVIDSGERRQTQHNRRAVVWRRAMPAMKE